MIDQRELDLFIELLKLLKKYGTESFESLASDLSDPETFERLSGILLDVSKRAKVAAKSEKTPKPRPTQHMPNALVILEKSDPERFALLFKFYNDLTAKKVLTTLRDVKDFAQELGLPEIRADSRQKALSPLINSLAIFPFDKSKARIQTIIAQQAGDRRLEDWSKIILNKKGK